MGRMERVYRIERLLKQKRAVPLCDLLGELEVSRATLKRDLEYMRDRLNAPIVWDGVLRGYRLEGPYSAPGLYFSPSELHALLVVQELLARMQPGLLAGHVAALRGLLEKVVAGSENTVEAGGLARRIRVLTVAARPIAAAHFQAASTATLARKRLELVYHGRGRDSETRREVSPQRLVYYRDNWYVDAWCHLREGLRSFALDAVRSAVVVQEPAVEVPEAQLDRELGAGYGIFSGGQTRTAILRFSPRVARWVSCENWHALQRGEMEPDGSYRLELPYAGDQELIGDIFRFGPDVEVVGPGELREKVRQGLLETLSAYSS